VPRGAWLLQTAAGSALGKMVVRLSKIDGYRTINVVRRREQGEELLRAGGHEAICTADESIEERVRAITGGKGIRYALDAVGGQTGSEVVRSLAVDGRVLVYGALSGEPLTAHSRVLISGNTRIEGFWLANWARAQSILTMLRLFRQINRLLADGTLASEVAATYPMDKIKSAVQQADAPGKPGKVLLRIRPAN